jgi:Tfp pilus assembly protein PilF
MKLDVARADLARLAVPDDPSRAAALEGILALAGGDAARAKRLLESAVARDPRDGEAWLDLARATRALGDDETSERSRARAAEVDPELRALAERIRSSR